MSKTATKTVRPSERLGQLTEQKIQELARLQERQKQYDLAQASADVYILGHASEALKKQRAVIEAIDSEIEILTPALAFEKFREDVEALPGLLAARDDAEAAVQAATARFKAAEIEYYASDVAVRDAKLVSERAWYRYSDRARRVEQFRSENAAILESTQEQSNAK